MYGGYEKKNDMVHWPETDATGGEENLKRTKARES